MSQSGIDLKDYSKLVVGFSEKKLQCKKIAVQFVVTIAKSASVKEIGLSGRRNPLKQNEGVLFVFEKEQKTPFWMKNTYIPLEIGFIDKQGALSEVYEMAVESNPKNPEKIYLPSTPVTAAIEVSPGSLKKQLHKRLLFCVERT